jgi:lysophospholipase L1-like esterase
LRSLSPAALVLFLLPAACADDPQPVDNQNVGNASAGGSAASGGSGGGGATSGSGGAGGAGSVTSAGGSAGNNGGSENAGGTGGSSGSSGSSGSGGDGAGGAPVDEMHWVGTWATGNQLVEPNNRPPVELANQTLRQMVRVSIGGTRLRLRLSNEYGDAPVTMNAVHVAKSTTGSNIEPESDVALTFGGSESVTIPAQQTATSDPFDFPLEPLTKLAITIAFGARSGEYSGHPGSRATSYIQSGNQVSAPSLSGTSTTHWYYIANIDVLAPTSTRAIAILGDSITDGRGSTTDGNNRWPDVLAERLQADPARRNIAVLNLGIGGNRITSGGLGPPGVTRFDSHILGQSGVKWVIVFEGVNDVGEGEPAGSVTAAYQQVISKSREAGLAVYGIPILPFAGYTNYQGYESTRVSVNEFIRADGNFDAFFPLDTVVGNGAMPPALKPEYDEGDHLHLNPTGLAALANAIDLSLFAP